MNKSVYIHIPFCKSICPYCDFCKFLPYNNFKKGYLKSLAKEIKDKYMGEKINTIYIGGGTPTALSINELESLFNIIKIFKKEDCEITIECNLNDLNEELIKLLSKNVNRVSIGIQSFNKNNLKYLGRKASFNDAKGKINLLKKYGINNINVDLIYAINNESIKVLKKDLKLINKLDITHVSTYSLMIEKHTILNNLKVKPISEDKDFKMYKIICQKLKKYGFTHYEISNFAKDGYESRHNLTYWNNENYYGFGPGASGFIRNIRYDNTKSLTNYIKGNYVLNKDVLSKKDLENDEVMLGLRKLNGINLEKFKEKYHENLTDIFDINDLLKEKLLLIKNGNIFINPSKLYISNEILVRMIKD